jgi:regulator of nucleoside diphosphate kinase
MKKIIVSDYDERRLRRLLEQPVIAADSPNVQRLVQELDRADIIPVEEMPEDVVALGSTVELELLDDGDVSTFTLALPHEADISAGRISVLAPIGTGMLGFRVGDVFRWPVPGGSARLRIRRLVENANSGMAVAP